MLGSGALLASVGSLVIALLPLIVPWRAGMLVVWLGLAFAELYRTRLAYRRSVAYRLYADGSIDVEEAGGGRRRAVFAAGSVVLPGVAWLCVRAADGARWGELIAGKPRKNNEWRRFQVICRSIPAC